MINQLNLKTFIKDDLFVLGRNIYPAACGNSWGAVNYMENLQEQLSTLGESIFFHILNGILFEIYFDSRGYFRNGPKTQMIDSVFRVEESEIFKKSFRFALQALTPYLKNLFYIPSSARGLSFDVVCREHEKGKKVVKAVFFEGDNVLYDDSGERYFDPSEDDFLVEKTREDIRVSLSQASAVPSYRLKVSFVGLSDDTETVLAPYRLNIKRLAH